MKQDILKSIFETDEGEVTRILKEAQLEGEAAEVQGEAAKLLKAYRDELPEGRTADPSPRLAVCSRRAGREGRLRNGAANQFRPITGRLS